MIILLTLLLFLCGCSHNAIYYDTWRPTLDEQYKSHSRLVTSAIYLQSPEDLQTVMAVGGIHIGWHENGGGMALRAGSTGGTHFYPDSSTSNNYAACFGNRLILCTAWTSTRWTRISVIRVPAERWHLLPPHLIPTGSDAITGVHASAIREGCITNRSRGIVQCSNDWTILRSIK